MTENELVEKLIALGNASDHLKWRRSLCIEQWAVDDCGLCPVQTDETPKEWRSEILQAKEYEFVVREAIPCWRWACAGSAEAGQRLARSLVAELEAMTEDESTEPNEPRWVAPPLDSRARAHVATLYGSDWGFICDCSSPRRHYSDRVRGGLLVCPCCLAHLSNRIAAAPENRFVSHEARRISEKLLGYIGWKPGDPPPVIYRTEQPQQSWHTRRESTRQLIEYRDGNYVFHTTGTK